MDALAHLAIRGERCGVIIANNRFDVVLLADAIEQLGGERDLALQRIYVMRAETCAQVRGCLRRLATHSPEFRVLMLIGFLEPFYDEDIRFARAQWLLTDALQQLGRIAARGVSVLVTVSPSPTANRKGFMKLVQDAADLALARLRNFDVQNTNAEIPATNETPRLAPPQQMPMEM